MHHGFTHDVCIEVFPCVERSEPSKAKQWVNVGSGSRLSLEGSTRKDLNSLTRYS